MFVSATSTGPAFTDESVVVYANSLALTAVASVNGGNPAELVLGTGAADTMRGNQSDDCILGGGGNDSLRGDNGTDVCIGGAGTDTFHATCETQIQ